MNADGFGEIEPVTAGDSWGEVEGIEQKPAARPGRKKISRTEAVIHGGVDTIPGGQKWSAGLASGALNLMKMAQREYGLGPRYWENIPETSYQQQLDWEREQLARSERERSGFTTLGKVLGGGASMAAIPIAPIQGMGRLMQAGSIAANGTAYGLLRGLGQGDTFDQAMEAAAVEAPVSGLTSLTGHTIASEVLSPVAKYMWNKAPTAANYAGDKLQDLAGWFKVNSLKPNPVVAERMAQLPGGVPGVGKEVLSEGLGGLTKKGTAKQIGAATKSAGAEMDRLAQSYDATQKSFLNADPIFAAGDQEAARLARVPTTRAAGERLQSLINEFRKIYTPQNPPNAQQMLDLKRVLAKEAYGASKEFARSSQQGLDEYAAGVAKMERAADSSLDNVIGPEFEAANLSFRRLLGANQAAKRSAARTDSNDLFGLTSKLGAAGAGGYAMLTGRPIVGGATLAASYLGNKYGSQMGARTLYGLGSALKSSANMSHAASRYAAPHGATLGELLQNYARPGVFNVPADNFAGNTPEEEEIRLREAMADAAWGQQ